MLEVRNLTKVYVPKKGKPVTALKNVNLKFEETGMVFVLGKSGSGKSTLLNLLGGLDSISGGEVIIKGKSSKDFSQSDFDSYRNTYLGFIFQEYNILNEFTVGQNIALALELQNKHADQKTVDALMKEVDLEGFSNRKPHELSGGQKQRVAIARALVKDPEIIMADEPTGALDSNTGRQIFETLQKLSKTKLVIIVSHDREYAEFYGDRVIEFKDGKVISDIKKYKSPSESFADGNITVTNDNIIHVKKRGKFEEQDKKELIRKVLNYLDNDSEDLIISTDARANREFKKNVRLDADGNREAFKETQNTDLQIKQYRANDFKLKKSNLPSRHAFRIGASSLKTKPFRLVLTILLCSIAFTLFGLVDTVAAYSKVATMHNSLNTAGITSSAIIKEREYKQSDYSYFNSEDMNSLDIGVLENKLNVDLLALERLDGWYSLDHHFGATGGDVTGNFDSYYVRAFNGYIESTANDISDFGFTITAGTYPTAANQIAISEHTAESFIDGGYHGDVNTTDISINSSSELIGKTLVFNNKTYTIKAIIDTNFNSKYQKIKGVQSYQDMLISSMMNEVNMLNQYGYHNAMFIANGFSYNFPQDENGNIISAQFKIPASDGQLKNIIEFSYELNNSVRYSLKNEISIVLDNFDYIMKTISQAFLYVGIAMAVFAALMLLNYISISISNKKKEIGILRAIGARSSDVFKIFFYESLIITIINTIFAIILTLVLCMVLNSQTFSSGIPLSILNFGIRQLLLIIAVGSFTAVISTFFPVYRIARKKPVDAIKR